MRILMFILLWIGIIIVVSLLNYHPKYIEKEEIIEDDKKDYVDDKIIIKPPYVYLILGLVFLPIATVFISSIIINKA